MKPPERFYDPFDWPREGSLNASGAIYHRGCWFPVLGLNAEPVFAAFPRDTWPVIQGKPIHAFAPKQRWTVLLDHLRQTDFKAYFKLWWAEQQLMP